jgi:hypothetical protein
VRLEHVRDRDAELGGDALDPIEITLGVHYEGYRAVCCQVAAVTKLMRIDRDYLNRHLA